MSKSSNKLTIKNYIREEIEKVLREKNVQFKRKSSLEELESADSAVDDQKVSQLAGQKADKEKQKAAMDGEIAKLKQQIDAIEKK